jgi:hypothetical protein
MKKLIIDKNESLGEVMDKIASSPESELVLVFPRNSKFRDSSSNFAILKREVENSAKHVVIESVDEEVLALSEAAGLENLHPLFSGGKSRSLSDILPSDAEEKTAGSKKKGKKEPKKTSAAGKKVSLKVPASEDPEAVGAESTAPVPLHHLSSHRSENDPEVQPEAEETEEVEAVEETEDAAAEDDFEPEYRRPRRRFVPALIALLVLGGAGVWAAGAFFAKATVKIDFSKTPWEASEELTATKTVSELDASRKVLPAEIFRDQRNVTQLFPASGRATVSDKAAGRITIYNAYSSSDQALVATTRFEAPDGKIYRLVSSVTVPGAAIKDGKIIPASIKADIAADQPGPDYNSGRVEKLTIPGFKNSPKFQGFYGTLEEGIQGGFIGERAVPTDSDMETAKAKTTEILRSSLESSILSRRPADFKVLDGASDIEITRLTVNRSTDANGNFSVFGEAKFQAIGFRESDVKLLLQDLVQAEHPNYVFRDVDLTYSDAKPNYDRGEVKFTVQANTSIAPAFAPDQFKSELAGEAVDAAQSKIAKLQDLKEANISLWPLWLRKLPTDLDRINLEIGYQ